jgi:hypothetical protein
VTGPGHEKPPAPDTGSVAPPIPLALAHLPVVAGLAVPWITPRTPDGRYLFGVIETGRQAQCLHQRRCQVCGRKLSRLSVLLVRGSDLPRRRISEPALHPWCARYTIAACPMVAGRLSRYRATERDYRGIANAAPDTPLRLGAPAEPWYAVWLTAYEVVTDPVTSSLAASFASPPPIRIRPISGAPEPPSALERLWRLFDV